MTFKFESNPDTFDVTVPEKGWYYIDGAGNKLLFRDKFEQPLNRQGYLNATGGKLGAGAAIVYKTGRVYKERDFARLGIPTNF